MTERSVRLAVAVVAVLLTWAASEIALAQPNLAQASAEEQAAARAAYAQGVGAFDRGDYAAALERFEAADHAVSSPNVKLMRARCLAKLGRDADANAMYDATQREAASWEDGRYQASADAASEEQRALAPKLSPAAAATSPAADAPAVTPATEPASPPVRLAPAEVSAAPAPASTSSAPTHASDGVPVLPIVLGAVGGAGLASFAVFGAMSNSQWDKLNAACSDEHCDARLSSHADRGRTYQTIANVSLGVGAALLAAGVTLFVLHENEDAPEVAVTPGGVRIRGAL